MRTIIAVVVVVCVVLSAVTANAIKPALTTGFVGNVEGLWYYENKSFYIAEGWLISDASGDGKADVVFALIDEINATLYLGAVSGTGKIAFNNTTTIWGWVPIKNYTEGRDKMLLIDDVNNDGVKDIAVTNDTVNTAHVYVNIISGKTGNILRSNIFAARNTTFYYSFTKTIDIKQPQDGIGELLLVMNHSVAKNIFTYVYYENYLRIYAIDPVTGNSIWATPIDRGPVNFLLDPTNPYIVAVTEDISGNNKPDIVIASSGLNISIGITFNNTEISVIDCQTQNKVWERLDLTSGFVLDFRVYDFTGDGKNDMALSKVSIGLSFPSFVPYIAANITEILYGNNGTLASKQSHDVATIFSGIPVNAMMEYFEFGPYTQILKSQNFADFTGDNVADLLLAPFDFGPFLNLTPKQSANLTLLNVKSNATVWQKEINDTMVLAFLYPTDINNDSFKEIYTILNPLSNANTSSICMYSGSNGDVLWNYSCPPGFNFWGMMVSSLANFTDLNNDGKPDFAFAQSIGNTGGYENIELTTISGTTGNVIYCVTHQVTLNPYPGTSVALELMIEGDISGDGKNDIGLFVNAQTTENNTLSYSYAINGTDGTTMWYLMLNTTYGDTGMIVGLAEYGSILGVPGTQCDLNANGLSDDAIVGTANAVFVVYTIPGSPVPEIGVLVISTLGWISFLTITLRHRKEEKI